MPIHSVDVIATTVVKSIRLSQVNIYSLICKLPAISHCLRNTALQKEVLLLTNMSDILWTVNPLRPSDAYVHQQKRPLLVQIMACRLVGAK